MFAYDIGASTYGVDNTHKGFISPSSQGFLNHNNELYYAAAAPSQSTAVLYGMYKYNFTTKTETLLVNLDNSAFTPDGVNFLDVNQSPIYLELQ